MKYTGKIAGMILVFIVWILIIFFPTDHSIYRTILISIVFILSLLIAWFLGSKYDTIKFLSETDELTGVYNRRIGIELIGYLQRLVDRNQEKLAIFMIDVDNFKEINDSFGHSKGDAILKNIAEILIDCTRKSDVVIRYGGDEFLMIFIHNDKSDIQAIKDRINERLNLTFKDIKLPVSISIGEAVYPDDSKEIDSLIQLADRAMYSDKRMKKIKL